MKNSDKPTQEAFDILFFAMCMLALMGFCSIMLGGCTEEYRRAQEQKQIPVADQTVQAEVGGKRFHAAFHGEFKGGYDNNIRHIFVITDSKTGKQYLTITGCGERQAD